MRNAGGRSANGQNAHYPAPADALSAYKRASFLLPTMRLLNSMQGFLPEPFRLNRTHSILHVA